MSGPIDPIGRTVALSTELVESILAAAARHFRTTERPVVSGVRQIEKPYSRVFDVSLIAPGFRENVFVKLPSERVRDYENVRTLFRKEYEILSVLAEASGAPDGTGSVTPLLYDTHTPALVTIGARGEPISSEISRTARLIHSSASRRRMLARASQCGSWLRWFHERTDVTASRFDVNELTDYIHTRLAGPQFAMRSSLGSRISELVTAATQIWTAELEGCSCRTAGRHNDFSSHNIVGLTDEGIRVLDFTMFDRGPTAFDVCSFWLELQMLKCDPTYSRRLLNDMQFAFISAYGNSKPSDADFQMARLRYSVLRWTKLTSQPAYGRELSYTAGRTRRHILAWLEHAVIDPRATH